MYSYRDRIHAVDINLVHSAACDEIAGIRDGE